MHGILAPVQFRRKRREKCGDEWTRCATIGLSRHVMARSLVKKNCVMRKFLIGFVAAVASTSFAENVEHPPVYRGQYYAFDVYPHGYKGYPGFPYYGAPFGSGGPAFAVSQEQTTTRGYSKDVRSSGAVRRRSNNH